MQIPTLVRRVLAGSLLPMLLGLPLPSAAATPSAQTMLNMGLLREWTGQASRSDITVKLGMKQTSYVKGPAGSASVSMRLQARQVPKAGSLTGDQEGSFTVNSLSVDESLSEGMPLNLESPLGFEWKLVDHTVFFRVQQMPQSLLDMIQKESDMNFSELVGRWIKIDLDEEGLIPPTIEAKVLSQNDPQLLAIKALAVKYPPLLVSRIESKTKAANGHDMWRLRLRVNPYFVNGLYNMAYKELPASPYATRAAALKKLNADFVQMRTLIARTGIVAVLDATDQTIARMEFGGSYPSPVKTCTYNYTLNKDVCRTTGMRTITVAIGINMVKDDGQPVYAPPNALDRQQLEDLLDSLRPEPELAPPTISDPNTLELDDTQTLTAPGVTVAPVDATLDHVLGSPNAKVTVITYADFECPYCQRMDPDLKQLLTDFPLDVRLVYRHFPLTGIHLTAQPAAEASECAAVQGGNDAFWKMHDKIMTNPALQNRDGFLSFADQIGLDHASFATCIDTHGTASRVQRDRDSGTMIGINGTPTSYVNGTKVEGAVPYGMLKDAVVAAGGIH